MANPVFSSYQYKFANYRTPSGEITNVTVSGDAGVSLSVSWTGPNGFTSGPHDGSSSHSLLGLSRGSYIGTVTDSNGLTGTTSVLIEDKPRLYLSVEDTTTTINGEGSIDISAFKHNGLGFRYELTYIEDGTIQSHIGIAGGVEAYSFTSLFNGSYRLIATETQELQYSMGGTSTQVASNRTFEYETYLATNTGSSGVCESPSTFVGEDIFEATGSTTESFLEFLTGDNGSIENLFDVTNVIIQSPKLSPNDGMVGNECSRASLKIGIKKVIGSDDTCDYVAFSLDSNGKVIFTHGDGTADYNITQECCSALGFTPELNDFGVYNCWWKEPITDQCQSYILTETVDDNGYNVFVNGDTGAYTNIVPTAECCVAEGLVATQNGDGYSCKVGITQPLCQDYTFTGTFETATNPEERYAIFLYEGGTTNSITDSECCAANDLETVIVNGSIRCYEAVPDCSGYVIDSIDSNRYVVFMDANGTLLQDVYNSECCTDNGFVVENQQGGTFKCMQPEPEEILPRLELDTKIEEYNCSLAKMRIIGKPNTWVKYRVELVSAPDHGYDNEITNMSTNEEITPSRPSGGPGSYCEGKIYVGSTGVTLVDMNSCARPPMREFQDSCVTLNFSIYNYDNKTIESFNLKQNRVCYPTT